MKVANSLKSLKRDLNSKLVKRRGKVYIINKKSKFKARRIAMNNQDHKDTWVGFTKFVLWGTIIVVLILIILALTLL